MNIIRRRNIDLEQLKQFFLFGLVGGFGTLLNTGVLWLLHTSGLHYLLAAAIATETAIISNFLGNDLITFREHDEGSYWRRFLSFQGISMFTLVGTLVILWALTSLFGERYLLVWNLIAILVMFVANFGLNKRLTWNKTRSKTVATILFAALIAVSTATALVAVSQAGYHPDAHKQVVVYGGSASTFSIDGTSYSGPLQSATCQGGQACRVGDFTDFTQTGTHTITAGGETSPSFRIGSDVYQRTSRELLEFFDAQRQQGSSYHADMHSYHDGFGAMADGSFIMEADQASATLSRLGSAYRRNPSLFSGTTLPADIGIYADILMSLQGIALQDDPQGFRTQPGIDIENAFTPGTPEQADITIYDPSGDTVATVPVTSLCGANATQACLDDAATLYKCQPGEVCLNMSYTGQRASITSSSGLAVARGFSYEFGCYFDVDLSAGNFNDAPNPCIIFDDTTSDAQTARALHALLQGYPALLDSDPGKAQQVLTRAEDTYAYLSGRTPGDAGAWGAALFLLYDYTGDAAYLAEAHAVRGSVSSQLESSFTHSNEYYWEEYVRHEDALTGAGLTYAVGGRTPQEFFTGKLIYDWEDMPAPIGGTGEHVYQLDAGGFHESRFMLIESVMASKAIDFGADAQYAYIPVIADNQLYWLTGMNRVQDGESGASPLRSYSFIFGVGDNPSVYHSRYLMTTGLADASGGDVIGAHGTDLRFRDDSGALQPFDGRFEILGHVLGALGNGLDGEAQASVYDPSMTFTNGASTIPGWISGAYDVESDTDEIFNYADNYHAFRFTETTNEIVAAATEAVAYRDAQTNGRAPHSLVALPSQSNTSVPPNSTNTSNSTGRATLSLTTSPGAASVSLAGTSYGTTTAAGQLTIEEIPPGEHLLRVSKTGYATHQENLTFAAQETLTHSVTLTRLNATGTGARIIDSDSSVGTAMDETADASFIVTLNQTGTVTWTIPALTGTTTQTTTGVEHRLSWEPGIRFSGDGIRTATITASVAGDSASWDVDVRDVINPYFEGPDVSPASGGDPITLHVYVQKDAYAFDTLSATINGRQRPLVAAWNDSAEVDWRLTLQQTDLSAGANVLESLTGTVGNTTVSFDGQGLEHYKERVRESRDSSRGGGGGGAALPAYVPFRPRLIYVVFEESVLGTGETQTLTLDMETFENDVVGVNATLQGPNSRYFAETLSLVDGSPSYGTWEATGSGYSPGKHYLRAITAWNARGETQTFNITQERSFYVVDGEVSPDEELGLVYTTLSRSTVENGSLVLMRLDARDHTGITNVSAVVTNNRGPEELSVEFDRIQGSATYGTYEGGFRVSRDDATYTVRSVTLSNQNRSETYNLTDRSVYVRPLPQRLTGMASASDRTAMSLREILQHPMTPAVIGFVILVVGLTLVFARDAIVGRLRR